jgi:hypothetical protein
LVGRVTAATHLGRARRDYRRLAERHGIDPRPSTLDDVLLWGDATLRVAGQAPLRRLVVRVRQTGHAPAGWLDVEGIDRSVAGLEVVRVLDWSVDRTTWSPVPNNTVRVAGELDLHLLRLMEARGPAQLPDPKELKTLKDEAVERLGKKAHRVYVRWRSADAPSPPHYLVILAKPVERDSDEGDGLPDRGEPVDAGAVPLALPHVLDDDGLRELARVAPDTPVLALDGLDKMAVLRGFTRARAAGTGRHTDQASAADLAVRLPAGNGLFLVLRDIVREDMDRIWPQVEDRRRLAGQNLPRRPFQDVDADGTCETIGRRAARVWWSKEWGTRPLGPAEWLRDRTLQRYPCYAECKNCEKWWLHGCTSCRSVLHRLPQGAKIPECKNFNSCPDCSCGLKASPWGPFGGDTDQIRDEIRKYRDANRKTWRSQVEVVE